jgi:hypothetical protein
MTGYYFQRSKRSKKSNEMCGRFEKNLTFYSAGELQSPAEQKNLLYGTILANLYYFSTRLPVLV